MNLIYYTVNVFRRQARDSDGSCSPPMDESERPDLSLLKPLWSLYTGMLEKEGQKTAILSVC